MAYETIRKLDLRKEVSPLTFAKTKMVLDEIKSGEMVQLRLSPGEDMDIVPKAVLNAGHQLIDIIKDGASFLVFIMKS